MQHGRVSEDDLRPVSALMRPGWRLLPPRSCRTRARSRGGVWRLKLAFADRAEAEAKAADNGVDAFLCRNCDFWHIGHLRGPRPG